jgi:hypothetical protein
MRVGGSAISAMMWSHERVGRQPSRCGDDIRINLGRTNKPTDVLL